MMEATVPPKRRFLKKLHGVTSQEMTFFRRTVVHAIRDADMW
jgi:hypothetical protein